MAANGLVQGALVAHGLDRTLFDEITRQLKAKAIRVKTSTLVDATIIASANEDDDEGHWVKHKGRPAVHGFKAHVGADADTALVEEIAITPANINDGKAGADALLDDPGEVFADSAYRGNHFGDTKRAEPLVLSPPACGVGTKPKYGHILRLGTNRSTAFVVASRKSSAHGRVFAGCDGESLPRQAFKFASLPSPTIFLICRQNQTNQCNVRPAHRSPSPENSWQVGGCGANR
ncbi:transposase [Mesorhizobium sp. YC-39]|nr:MULTISPECIES: transposase [unclassified Mesorhizobium]MCV3211573.1 transposase [Mesorhizobium sp. YC-2]MCV3233229.1 transposase [Mesorhizobium sp. YC-39]